MPHADYQVRLKDQDGTTVAIFDNWRRLYYKKELHLNGFYSFTIEANDERTSLFVLDGRFEVWRRVRDADVDWYLDFEGFHRTTLRNEHQDGTRVFISEGVQLTNLLDRATIAAWAGTSRAQKDWPGNIAIKDYVDDNLGNRARFRLNENGDNTYVRENVIIERTAQDLFNRAASAATLGSMPTAQAWTILGGATWGIQHLTDAAARTHKVAYVPTPGVGDSIAYVETSLADAILHGEIFVNDTASFPTGAGFAFRVTDASNYWAVRTNVASTRYELIKVNAGVPTTVANFTTTVPGGFLVDHIRVWFEGNVITAYRARKVTGTIEGNWEEMFTTTDAFNNTATKHGMIVNSGGTGTFDAFWVDQLLGADWVGARAWRELLPTIRDMALDLQLEFEVRSVAATLRPLTNNEDTTNATVLGFRCVTALGRDRSLASVNTATGLTPDGVGVTIFDSALGNAESTEYALRYLAERNRVIMLGQGQEEERTVVIRESTPTLTSPWSRYEISRQDTQVETTTELNIRADEVLDEHQAKETYTFQALDTDIAIYGRDWSFGDKVTGRTGSTSFSKKVIGVTVEVQATSGTRVDKITPEMADVP